MQHLVRFNPVHETGRFYMSIYYTRHKPTHLFLRAHSYSIQCYEH
jgi:hypothetical protein